MATVDSTHTPDAPPAQPLNNEVIAQRLDAVAELLEAQEANAFRVRAYRNAATLLRQLNEPVAELLAREGVDGLHRLPGIGESLARSIERLAQSGDLPLLQRLRGEIQPERVLATVPGIGPKLASRIHDELAIESLGDLLAAAYDGRLNGVPGFGRGRLRAIRETLGGRLRRPPPIRAQLRPAPTNEPPVSELLDVDREYRERARAGALPKIAPRRFNPTHEAWLPVLHTVRGETHYSALYSNTARAHELNMTHDWVVIYRDDPNGAGQWTVITSRFGPLQGKRVVRGREEECQQFYMAAGKQVA